jgi:hypothetical protein
MHVARRVKKEREKHCMRSFTEVISPSTLQVSQMPHPYTSYTFSECDCM